MNGNSSKARTRFFSGNCWFIAKANASPPTIFNNVAAAVYRKVLALPFQKIGSLRLVAKFFSPTKVPACATGRSCRLSRMP